MCGSWGRIVVQSFTFLRLCRSRHVLEAFILKIFLAAALACLGIAALFGQSTKFASSPSYEVYAVRFGTLPQFPVANLVAGGDKDKKLDIPVMVWVLKGADGRVVLVDSGFYQEKFVTRWKVQNFTTPAAAVSKLGIRADQVSDIILTHIHWDHADGADLFPSATVWIQKDEYTYYTGEAWQDSTRRGAGADADVMSKLVTRNMHGELRFVDGDNQTILPGITCYTGGRHTYASQYVTVETAKGPIVLASDNVYLYENLSSHAPIAQTLDAAANLKAQDRMRTLAEKSNVIVPGHDPAVFTRFPAVTDGIVQIVRNQ
jgi:glyoxylase-like metal-dependent hydrolase (beta-lactamase superfamily II)